MRLAAHLLHRRASPATFCLSLSLSVSLSLVSLSLSLSLSRATNLSHSLCASLCVCRLRCACLPVRVCFPSAMCRQLVAGRSLGYRSARGCDTNLDSLLFCPIKTPLVACLLAAVACHGGRPREVAESGREGEGLRRLGWCVPCWRGGAGRQG